MEHTGLCGLPLEVLGNICEYLDENELGALSVTCKTLFEVVLWYVRVHRKSAIETLWYHGFIVAIDRRFVNLCTVLLDSFYDIHALRRVGMYAVRVHDSTDQDSAAIMDLILRRLGPDSCSDILWYQWNSAPEVPYPRELSRYAGHIRNQMPTESARASLYETMLSDMCSFGTLEDLEFLDALFLDNELLAADSVLAIKCASFERVCERGDLNLYEWFHRGISPLVASKYVDLERVFQVTAEQGRTAMFERLYVDYFKSPAVREEMFASDWSYALRCVIRNNDLETLRCFIELYECSAHHFTSFMTLATIENCADDTRMLIERHYNLHDDAASE